MSLVRCQCGVPGCEWTQEAQNLTDSDWLLKMHNHRKHGSSLPEFYLVAGVRSWQPPKYVP